MIENDSFKIQYQTTSEQSDTEEPPLKCSETTKIFKNKFYPNVSEKDWNSWHWQIRNSVTSYEDLVRIFGSSDYELSENINLPLRITPYYASTIASLREGIGKCVIPSSEELIVTENEENDSLHEESQSPVKCIVHRYPDRVLFLVTDFCASNCRYCTRSRLISRESISKKMWEEGIEYIQNHPEVRDVLISGGDVLTLSDDNIEYLLKRIREIKHVELLRLGSKVPIVLPHRITDKLVKILRKYYTFLNIHITHPNEFTEEVKEAIARLVDNGIVLGSQTVLLKGINDDVNTMKKLMHELIRNRIRPYYLYQCDRTVGTHHFRTKIEKGIEIMRHLRGFTSGMCVPYFIVDTPGGKIPLLPDYVVEKLDNSVVLKNYEGKKFTYHES